jgi:lipopolysaccharide biosynthesis protein
MNRIDRVKNKLRVMKNISPKHEISSYKIDQHYTLIRRQISLLKKGNTTEVACVVHLYYTESWNFLSKKLKEIKAFPFDLFISLPTHNLAFKNIIEKEFPEVIIYEAPNRGRDVLPFMSIAKILYENGYTSVLKLHSKKSTHRTDGGDWFKDMVNFLVPKNYSLQLGIANSLKKSATGVIGPAEQYTSLTVNFEANGSHMTKIINKLYSKELAHETLQVQRNEYGFFAGTMFWLRLESIAPLLRLTQARKFETESGQIDATFAHALERLLCVVPELEKKAIYEINKTELKKIKYNTGVVPDWSKVYIGPKSTK